MASIIGVETLQHTNGTTAATIDSNGSVSFPNTTSDSVGVGQTWQDVTSSRTSGTTYTNSTGKPIMVSISTNMGTNQRIETTVGGVKIADMGGSTIYGDMGLNVFIVPDNTTYVVTATQGTIQIWAELR